ncbi:bacillithiol system protein YtxJ [Arachidicoccus rhizosphaerae]|uniref:Bacillithiol system protein YtxJ n=1 Tax=Arachidicoccus rhizosphaerae TaxID=551991 RepID=A0A1H4AFP5_9BACT|nr:bacillithiol system redox-active protein YtxJ [Arachidicoccus rhizosphaerae]SEA34344.1 bacillithiol system protein YtxJ [Arachidicoccus rhizosphaerae]
MLNVNAGVDWQPLDSAEVLEKLIQDSFHKPQIIFKHSISCPTSAMAKSRLDRSCVIEQADYYLLDLWNYRDMSNMVAHKFGVEHQSPQILIISAGKCVYNESHYGITQERIQAEVAAI